MLVKIIKKNFIFQKQFTFGVVGVTLNAISFRMSISGNTKRLRYQQGHRLN